MHLLDVIRDEALRQDNLAILDHLGTGAYGTRLGSADVTGIQRIAGAERDAALGVPRAGNE